MSSMDAILHFTVGVDMSIIMNSVNNNLANQWCYATKTLNSTNITSMFGSPILFDTIPAPASNQIIIIKNWGFDLTFNSSAYTGGGAVGLYYDNARTQSAVVTIAATNMNASASVCPNAQGIGTIVPTSNTKGNRIYISNATGAFASGNSNVTFFAIYAIVTLDSLGAPQNSIDNQTNSASLGFAELYIPSASVQTLNGTPITIVSSPGSGKAIIPDRMISLLIFNSVGYTNSAVSLIWGTSGTQIMSGTNNFIGGTVSQQNNTGSPGFSNSNPSNANNNAVQVKATINPGSSGNSALKIYLSYSIITL